MSFQEDVKTHMVQYKANCDDSDLRKITADGIYNNKPGYKHILPITDPSTLSIFGSRDNIKKLNLLPAYRESCWSYIEPIKSVLNTYFHHLNSSQGMCFNFFFPFASDPELLSLLMTILLKDKAVNFAIPMKSEFEYNSYLDKTDYAWDSPTNFDFYVSSSKQNFFFEIKYKEFDFKKHKNDNKDRAQKYETMYHSLANGVIVDDKNNINDFLGNYQIMRNLVHLKNDTNRDNYVIFVYPERNSRIAREALESYEFLLPEFHDRLVTISWETLYSLCIKELTKLDKFNGLIKEQLTEFKKKYLFWM